MPSHWDSTYHWQYSKPSFDTEENEDKQQIIKETDYVLEKLPPQEPTKEQEIEYIDWLQDQFWNDPWITPRFRKYMAGPKRWPWKNKREIKRQYYFTYFINGSLGFILTWPLGVYLARKFQKTQAHYAKNRFRLIMFSTCLIGGFFFARFTTDPIQMKDSWYDRPDTKPFKAMIPAQEMDITEKSAYESHYQSFRNKDYKQDKKRRTWYRLFFPGDADYTVKINPYATTHKDNIYNPTNGYYHVVGPYRYGDHLSEATNLSAEEIVLIVDEDNNPVGKAKRRDVRQKNLWHRASYIFVYNSKGQIYVQKRSLKKDYCPGYYDLCNGGVVGADETDEQNAERELEEEIGVTGVELKVIKRIKFEDSTNRLWGNLFAVQYDKEDFKLQEEEVDALEKWTVAEVLQKIEDKEKITPDSILAFKEFLTLGLIQTE